MKEKILQSLKNRYSNLGLSTETLEGVANQLAVFVTEETAIEPAVSGAESMLKSFQKYADGRVTTFKTESDKSKSEIEQLKAKLAELEKPTEEPKGDESVKTMVENLNKQIATLNESITKLSGERAHETLTQKFTALIGDVPKSYYGIALSGKQFKDEAEVAEFAEQIKTGYAEHKQELANIGFEQTRQPETGSGERNESKDIANLINAGTKEIIENSKN